MGETTRQVYTKRSTASQKMHKKRVSRVSRKETNAVGALCVGRVLVGSFWNISIHELKFRQAQQLKLIGKYSFRISKKSADTPSK